MTVVELSLSTDIAHVTDRELLQMYLLAAAAQDNQPRGTPSFGRNTDVVVLIWDEMQKRGYTDPTIATVKELLS